MHLALALLLGSTLPTANPTSDNLDFHTGTTEGWEGDGFSVGPATRLGPSLDFAVCSSDCGPAGRTAMLHRTLDVPATGGIVRCYAHVVRSKNSSPNESLDVVLLAPGKKIISKQVRHGDDWQTVPCILPAENGRSREYVWNVSAYAGQTLRVAIVDDDKRRDCFIVCSGLRILPADKFEAKEFGRAMYKLTTDNKLSPAARFESKHFLAYSNADDDFSEMRLLNCEMIYDLFFDHFRKRGFKVREPGSKMMVAVFDSQAGFEAYVGQRMDASITGLYHTKTNRLVVYDYGQNRAFVDSKSMARGEARRIGSDMERRRYIDTVNRRASEIRKEANIGTVMHEVAHQLSFNCGLLNREGDVSFWLAEGLATYCEATDNGAWQGIGETNADRLMTLAVYLRGGGKLIPVQNLIERDDWMKDTKTALLAYAQSWALFKMLMEERPAQMRTYLQLVYSRRATSHRITDFNQAFNTEAERLDLRYQEYVKEQLERWAPKR
jgi:hypothetical protein